MKDQHQLWNNAHTKQWLHAHSQKQTAFAEEVNNTIPADSSILELGCGEGNDSAYFAQKGHKVLATDFSDVVIAQNQERWPNPNLQFTVHDTSTSLEYPDNSFDVAYARLSLHYFPDQDTRRIFAEIARVLKPGGYLCFMCKEVHDPIYGRGAEIEPHMFELEGHVRHFFSEVYTRELLAGAGLVEEALVTGQEQIYDRISAFIKVIARKPAA
jgi:ubiquinone/menaquinone biosynthesis C-methylase UbiE